MPTYVYRCTSCNHVFEVFQRVSDEPIQSCEKCDGPVNKIFHPAGIVFKGSGFYATDHGRKSTAATTAGSAPVSGSSPSAGGTTGSGSVGTEN